MLEVDLENLIVRHPDLIEPNLKLVGRQETLRGKRVDLMFRDSKGITLVIEVKRGVVSRTDVGQLVEYCHYFYELTGTKPRGMLIGTRIPAEIIGAATYCGLECREIPFAEIQATIEADGYDTTEVPAVRPVPVGRPYVAAKQATPGDVTKAQNESTKKIPITFRRIGNPIRGK